MKPFGVNVVEVVTGFVQSDILRHGFYAPDTSMYLPIKEKMEEIKFQGNRNGMPAHEYAEAIVRRLVTGRAGAEIWQGGRAFWLRVMLMVLPRWLLVCAVPFYLMFISNCVGFVLLSSFRP